MGDQGCTLGLHLGGPRKRVYECLAAYKHRLTDRDKCVCRGSTIINEQPPSRYMTRPAKSNVHSQSQGDDSEPLFTIINVSLLAFCLQYLKDGT